MGRKRNPDKVRKELFPKFESFFKENGTKISDTEYTWDKYPLCVIDVCVNCVKMVNDDIQFGNEYKGNFNIKHTFKEMDAEYLPDILSDLEDYEKKKKK